jgi:hypothetical protein
MHKESLSGLIDLIDLSSGRRQELLGNLPGGDGFV